MSLDLIKVAIPDITVDFEPLIVAERDDLRERASTIHSVSTDIENEVTVRLVQSIKRLLKSIEKDEKQTRSAFEECKDKVRLELGRFTAILVQEYTRLTKLVSDYDSVRMEKLRKQEEAVRLRIAEQLAAEAKAKADAEAAARLASSEEASMAAIQAAIDAEERVAVAKESAEAAIRVEAPKIERAEGQVTRNVVRWEITDQEKVFAVKPHWFSITPKRSVINDEVVEGFELDGLRVWTETITGIRV